MKTILFFIGLSLGAMVQADRPSVHGMLLFGKASSYASHLPMFHSPHDYQFIFKLSLSAASNSETLRAYATAQAEGESLFTLEPELMDLTQLMSGAKTNFKANLFKGHFERGGENLGVVTVQVEKIIYAQRLNAQQAPYGFELYSLFGEAGEYYAAHIVKSAPSFDAILAIDRPLKSRSCAGTCPELIPVADTALPLSTAVFKEGVENKIPLAGENLGNASVLTHINKVIYLEQAELAH